MDCTKKEIELIVKICERAEDLKISQPEMRFSLLMDLKAIHESIGLNLEGLLGAEDFDFAHDVVGIRNHINRETKELEDFFLPRYAQQKSVDELIDKAVENSKQLSVDKVDGRDNKELEQ